MPAPFQPSTESEQRLAELSPELARPTKSGTSRVAPRTGNSKPYFGIKFALISLVLFAAIWAAYGETRHNSFINYDDFEYVADNLHVRAGLTWANIRWAFTTTYFFNWHPLTWLSYMLDAQLAGLSAAGFHLSNVLIHGVNAVLLFGVLLSLTGALWPSALVAGVFGIHSINVESVAWVAERKTLLCTTFGLLAVWAYARYVRSRNWKDYAGVLVFFALSLMCKPMLVTLPFLLLLLDVWPLRRTTLTEPLAGDAEANKPLTAAVQLAKEKLPLLALCIASSVATLSIQLGSGAGADMADMSLGHRLANALTAYVSYLGKLFWPTRLALFYPQHQIPVAAEIGSAFVLLAITAFAVVTLKRRPYFAVGWFWFVGNLVPVIGIVQVGEQALADRYAYVPMIGIAIVLVWGAAELLDRVPKLRLALPAFAGLAMILLILLSQIQVRYWKNSVTLWTHSLEITTDNCIAHANLGSAYGSRGRYDEAVMQLNDAISICPKFTGAHQTLGTVLTWMGRLPDAESQFAWVVKTSPTFTIARNNLAKVLADEGRIDEARQQYQEVLRQAPNDETALAALTALERQQPPVPSTQR